MKILLVGHEQGSMNLLTHLNSLVDEVYHERFEQIDSKQIQGYTQFCYPDKFFENNEAKDRYDAIIGMSYSIWDTHDGPAWDEPGYRFCFMNSTQDYATLISYLEPRIGDSTIEQESGEKNNWLVIRCPDKEEIGRNIINQLLDYTLQEGGNHHE